MRQYDVQLSLEAPGPVALNGPIGTPDPTTTKPNHQLDGGEEKQQTHGGLLGTKLKD